MSALRPASGAMAAALAGKHTAPLLLVELGFPSYTVRYSTFGTQTWRSLTWQGRNMRVSGLEPVSTSAPVIEVYDPAAAIRTLLLSDTIIDQPVTIWQADALVLGDGDPFIVFAGVGGAATWAQGKARIHTGRANARSALCPRTRMTPDNGYNFLAPKGYEFQWGNKIVRLE